MWYGEDSVHVCTPVPVEVPADRTTVRVTPTVTPPEGFGEDAVGSGLHEINIGVHLPMAPPPVRVKQAKKVGECNEFVVKWAPKEEILPAV